MIYKCIEDFDLELYGENHRPTKEVRPVHKDTLWSEDTEYSPKYEGNIRLSLLFDGRTGTWIEVPPYLFDKYFIPAQVAIPGIYQHFKHLDEGEYLNYVYVTIGISKPVEDFRVSDSHNNIYALYTETEPKKRIKIGKTNKVYIHSSNTCNEELVLYKSLYDDSFAYARPRDIFLSEVDHIKYPDIHQKCRFKLIGGTFK